MEFPTMTKEQATLLWDAIIDSEAVSGGGERWLNPTAVHALRVATGDARLYPEYSHVDRLTTIVAFLRHWADAMESE